MENTVLNKNIKIWDELPLFIDKRKFITIVSFVLFSTNANCQTIDSTELKSYPENRPLTLFYNRYPWEGQFGFKPGIHYSNTIGFDFGIIKSDLPRKKDKDYNNVWSGGGYVVANQNIYVSLEVNLKNQLGIKAGYEINCVFLGGRMNYIQFFDMNNGKSFPVFMPEAGITLLGFFNLFYGRTIPLNNHEFDLGRNRISFNINLLFLEN